MPKWLKILITILLIAVVFPLAFKGIKKLIAKCKTWFSKKKPMEVKPIVQVLPDTSA